MSLASQTEESSAEMLLAPFSTIGVDGVYPDDALNAQIAARASEVRSVAPDAVYWLMTPGLCGRHAQEALQWLREVGLLVHVLPELDATVEFSQEGGRRHKDVWEHTKAVVRQAVPRPVVRWAALLHDIGKVPTRRFLPDGKVTFHGHAEEGVRMFRRGPAKRIGFPADDKRRIEDLIRHHLRAGQYDGSWTDNAVRRFHREMEPWLTDLLDLSRADVTSKRPGKRQKCLTLISELSKRMRELEAEDARPKPLPPGLGHLLMQSLGLPPGKHIGELRERLEQCHARGELQGGREPEYYLEFVERAKLLDGIEIRPPRGFQE